MRDTNLSAHDLEHLDMFSGLSAFPLTPLVEDSLDEPRFTALIERLSGSGVDSITVLGSTGMYAYLDPGERARAAELAVPAANGTPVAVGVGALRTSQVLANVRSAELAGAQGLLLAPVSYQPLTEDEVFALFAAVCAASTLPVILYDNPGTTHFNFSLELYARIGALPNVASIKIPPLPANPQAAREHVAAIRSVIPAEVTLGISGDAVAAAGLAAGCDGWYSVLAGTLPELALRISKPASESDHERALAESGQLASLWEFYTACGGSARAIAGLARELGMVSDSALPAPLHNLSEELRTRARELLRELGRI
ncbi:dihydrodipicolinate synthase family protein [Glutamicibacter sp. AOP12-B1-11]|uniref:dihydrodipicolinate synthase family protein n=1 Tax=Glutamicibacter sp. AOP12-B1-11 TaxID=3457725 RepID=UPI0040341227